MKYCSESVTYVFVLSHCAPGEVGGMFVLLCRKYQSGQSLVKANRRRCYCSSEPLSLQPTEEGQFSFFFPLLNTILLVRCQSRRQGFLANHSSSHAYQKRKPSQLLFLLFMVLISAFLLHKSCMLIEE